MSKWTSWLAALLLTISAAAPASAARFWQIEFGGSVLHELFDQWSGQYIYRYRTVITGLVTVDSADGFPQYINGSGTWHYVWLSNTDFSLYTVNYGPELQVDASFAPFAPPADGVWRVPVGWSGSVTEFAPESNHLGLTTASGALNLLRIRTSDTAFAEPLGAFYGFAGAGVPEPTSWALMLVGLGAIGAAMRRRRPGPLAA